MSNAFYIPVVVQCASCLNQVNCPVEASDAAIADGGDSAKVAFRVEEDGFDLGQLNLELRVSRPSGWSTTGHPHRLRWLCHECSKAAGQ